jgi:3-dehydroquinate synthase
MPIVDVDLKERAYSIEIGPGLLDSLGIRIKETIGLSKATVITNPVIWSFYGKKIRYGIDSQGIGCDVLLVPDGEKYKTLQSAAELYKGLVRSGATRKDPIIAVGGGVIGDLAGFVAATYMRGVPFVQIPTSLLAQVDSSVGGKVAVDIKEGKNLVGAFHQPAFVVADTDTLSTLPDRQLSQGMAEVIKTAFLSEEKKVRFLEDNMEGIINKDADKMSRIIADSVAYKAMIVEKDEKDTRDIRAVLNYGHTAGHAIEAMGSYSRYLHGEAVAIGMTIAARLSRDIARMSGFVEERQTKLLKAAGLPVKVPEGIDSDKILTAMKADKKRTSEKITFILLEDIGKPVIKELDEKPIRKVLEEMSRG